MKKYVKRKMEGGQGKSLVTFHIISEETSASSQAALNQNRQNVLESKTLLFRQVMSRLSLTSCHLSELIVANTIPHFTSKGAKICFDRSEFENWIVKIQNSRMEQILKSIENTKIN